MATFFGLLLGYMRDCFRSHERLKAEILTLRHQLNILHRKAPKRLRLSGGDRALYRRCPDIGNATAIVRPETIIRWHRMGFRAGWRWKSHNPGGRPGIDQELRDLVRRMCKENPLWGARTPSPYMDRRHDQSDGGMASPPDYRSLSLGRCSRLSHP